MCLKIRTDPLERAGIEHDPGFFKIGTPAVMGILNVTPDSFSDGGECGSLDGAVAKGKRLVEAGADILDIGGESTRPFASPVSAEEEISRVIPVIRELSRYVKVPISIDTRHAYVASLALDSGAAMVNDVYALREVGMEGLVAERGATAVLMHMKGTPKDMQVSPDYADVVGEVREFLLQRIEHMGSIGCPKDRLIVDPGIGFGKRVSDNLTILRDLGRLKDIGCPILVGASRKSFIGKVLDAKLGDRLEGSLAAAVVAAMNGASILRVHDVRETKKALEIVKAVSSPDGYD
jgi:dihydropteroate synthase